MLQQLIDNYETFGDALITQFRYNSYYDYYKNDAMRADEVELYISCFNKNRNYERDLIRIVCNSILHINFHKFEGMIFEALLKNENGIIILDFIPDLISNPLGNGVIAEENLNSDCIVMCKQVEYSIIQ